MRRLIPFLFLLSTLAAADPADSAGADRCATILHAESIRSMSQGELAVRRLEVKQNYAKAAAEAICESSASITYDGYRQLLDQASQENRQAGGTNFDTAELYFFLECGEDQVKLSPLAYHGFNLNRDDYGFLGEATLAIAWMSTGYLEIKDPDYDRSFMDIVNRVLAYARKQESETEVEMYEALLQELEGFREDYVSAADECRKSER
jgi:hypothetical protein